ncbi:MULTISPECIES: GNAT family N-acetyltransferase [unclassified Mesorhizobium]|uniref:GNAT family N-acetyltransferase n=1 Tax=unclassified Mesorhizobium TaxID=325217 RepID=UPI001CCA51DD|nr:MULTISPECIES: GNAT family N-acetyltransferase [unclassified Mesorhizobium]MBZ9693665.1 GNAT family N-acetyltransferase [Mesorhizobium sp. CO1-1-9]MBZ9724759.1 GNAT family N-acetyltransferase [Mesorhizobium sp. CO1-1-11]MBZ9909109.1 GNAT family N-acetyltransferase [Mesorhizobium sp. BR115XR7A]MBZ9932666.1 GNAT family N-acetyltransferase [Mesorhizobium sp. BR1-1-5]
MPDCEISFDLSRIDFRATSDLLMESYWGAGRSDEFHRRAFANSFCAAAYIAGKQVGFGRAITDRTVFAYLADIIVWPEHRGQGVGLRLVRTLIDHPELSTVSHWSLSTSDAHGVYEKLGFKASMDGRYMRLDRAPHAG